MQGLECPIVTDSTPQGQLDKIKAGYTFDGPGLAFGAAVANGTAHPEALSRHGPRPRDNPLHLRHRPPQTLSPIQRLPHDHREPLVPHHDLLAPAGQSRG